MNNFFFNLRQSQSNIINKHEIVIDYDIYRKFNRKLYLLDNLELINHFNDIGIHEDRVYNINSFNKKYNNNISSRIDILKNYNNNL